MRTQLQAFHKGTIAAGLFLVVAGAGLAVAQDDAGDDADAADPGGADVGVQRRANLNPARQLEAAESIEARGTQMSRQVGVMLDEARQDRDIIRVTCIDDKFAQINANLRTTTVRVQQLRDAIEANDASRRNHEYVVITVLGQNFQVLEREAMQCVGQDMFETGATRVETDVQDDSPTEDPNKLPDAPELPIPYIPPPASGVI